MNRGLDFYEVGKRAIKYILEGLVVSVATYLIPNKGGKGGSRLSWEEILVIALVASSCFAFLDLYSPSIGTAARQGAGLGIGFGITGFPSGIPPL